MRILTAEIRKTLTLRFFLILLVAIAANFLLFRHSLRGGYMMYEQDQYLNAMTEVLEMEDDARLPTLQERYDMLQICRDWENYDYKAQEGYADPEDITEEMLQYQEIYESGEYLRYTDNLYSERSLVRALLQDVQRIAEHTATLEAVIQEAKMKTSVAIFAKPGTFSYRSQLATIEKFESLLYIQPTYDISDGVLKAQNSAVTDLIALLMILFLCTELVVTEHKNGMLPILRATRKGRLPLILSKATVTFVLAFFIAAALWLVNLGYCAYAYGLGDLSRPVQSLDGFTASTLEMSVGQYLIFRFIAKWLLYGIVGLLCLVMGLVWQGAMPTWLTVGGFLGVEYILARTIEPISNWNILKYVNLSNLIFEADWLAEYRNLNFFGYPVEVLLTSCTLVAVLLLGSTAVLCWLFCRKRIKTLPRPKLRLAWPKWLPRPGRSVKIANHENWKLLVACCALFVLILFLLLNLQDPRVVSYSAEELYYKNYMDILAGPMDEEKEAYIQSEIARFNGIYEQMAQLRQDAAEGKINQSDLEYLMMPLERALKAEEVLNNRILPQRDRLLAMKEEGKEGWFVYEKGYSYLFGDNTHEKTGAATMVLAASILCFANLYPLETTSGMLPLLNVYSKGRRKTAATKLILCALFTAILFVIAQIPDYRYVAKNFDFPALSAPLCSLESFSAWSDGLPIWGGIAVFEALRLMGCLTVTMLVVLLSVWVSNQIITMSVSAGILLMPMLLHLLEINFLDKVSFYLPLTGTELLSWQEGPTKALVYYGITFALGVAATIMTLRYAHNGYRMNKKIMK